MKVFISADIEGITGICNWDETTSKKADYTLFQNLMNQEVKAACIGANKAGCNEIVVRDGHGSARNLIHGLLPENTKLIRGWTGHPYCMMDGIDSSFDAVLFVGYHSGTGSMGNPLAHAMTSSCKIFVNEQQLTEFELNSLTASYLGVPVVFLSGDQEICQIAKGWDPSIETVVAHQGLSGGVCSEHPLTTQRLIEEKVHQSLKNVKNIKVKKLSNEFNCKIVYSRPQDAYFRSFYPGVKLENSCTLSFKSNDYFEVLRNINFLTILTSSM